MKSLARASVLASLLAATAVSQLLVPSMLDMSDNIKLIAHTQSSNLAIENWEVASGNKDCDQEVVLSGPRSIAANPALTFFFNPSSQTLQSKAGGITRGLVIAGNGDLRSLTLSCRSNGTVGLAVKSRSPDYIPVLDYEYDDGKFYAGRDASQSQSEPTKLFYGNLKTAQTVVSTVEVALIAKATPGPYHGDLSLVSACNDVKDGQCKMGSI